MATDAPANGSIDRTEEAAPSSAPEISFADAQRDPRLLDPTAKKDLRAEPRVYIPKGPKADKGKQPAAKNAGAKGVGEPGRRSRASSKKSESDTKGRNGVPADARPALSKHAQERSEGAQQSNKDDRKRTEEWKKRRQFDEAVGRATALMLMERKLGQERERASLWLKEGRTADDMRAEELLGRQVKGLWESTRPSAESQATRRALIKDVNYALNRRWQGCGLEVAPFGSTLTGLVEATSDLDLCLLDPTRPRGVGTPAKDVMPLPEEARYETLHNRHVVGMAGVPDYYSVKLIARALDRHGFGKFRDIVPIWHAKVPIVKFVHGPSGLACDLNVNDSFGLRNSAMIKAYADLLPDIVAPFVFCIKKWSSKRHINDPSGQSGAVSFNSYTVCLLALQYLQLRGIIPNLQAPTLLKALGTPTERLWQRPSGKSVAAAVANTVEHDESSQSTVQSIPQDPVTGARSFDTSFAKLRTAEEKTHAEQVSRATSIGQPFQADGPFTTEKDQHVVLGSLLVGFFEWITKFDFDMWGISLREGHPFRRMAPSADEDEGMTQLPFVQAWDPKWAKHPILCQDPFILDRNTCGAILPPTRTIILDEARRAVNVLTKNDSLSAGEGTPPLLSELLIDFEYEQLLEHHQSTLEKWEDERKAQVAQKALQNLQNGRGSGPLGKTPTRRVPKKAK